MRAPSICDSQPPPLLLCVARRFFLLLATIVTTVAPLRYPSATPSALAAHTVTAVATAAAALASTAAALAAAAHATAPNVVLDLGDAPLMFLLRLIADLSRPAARGFFRAPVGPRS